MVRRMAYFTGYSKQIESLAVTLNTCGRRRIERNGEAAWGIGCAAPTKPLDGVVARRLAIANATIGLDLFVSVHIQR